MNTPLVSVIIPSYNVESYIDQCIKSIMNQSYSNIEIIVIDDGSNDSTSEKLKKYQNYITLYLNQKNKGQGAVRNEGLNKTKGKYVLFVDSDDWIEPQTIEMLVEKAEATNSDLVRFNGISFNDELIPKRYNQNYDFSNVLDQNKLYSGENLLEVNKRAYSASPCLYLTKRTLIIENNIWFPEGILHEDEYFTINVMLEAKKMSYINENFYHRRYRPSSTMTNRSEDHIANSFSSYLILYKLLENNYSINQYNKRQKAFLKRQLLSIYSGLQLLDVKKSLKNELSTLDSISFIDKIRIRLSRILRCFIKLMR